MASISMTRTMGIKERRGSRSSMKLDQRYDCVYIFGAVCQARDTGCAIVMPDANIPAMNHHLAEISRCVEGDAHAVILIDGAGWHKDSGVFVVPDASSTPMAISWMPAARPGMPLQASKDRSKFMRGGY